MDTPFEIWVSQFKHLSRTEYLKIVDLFFGVLEPANQIDPDIRNEPSEAQVLNYALNDQDEGGQPELWDAAFLRRVIKTCNKKLLRDMFHPDKHSHHITTILPESKDVAEENNTSIYNPYTEWTAAVNKVRETINLCIQSMGKLEISTPQSIPDEKPNEPIPEENITKNTVDESQPSKTETNNKKRKSTCSENTKYKQCEKKTRSQKDLDMEIEFDIFIINADDKTLKSDWWSHDVRFLKAHASNIPITRGEAFARADKLGFYKELHKKSPNLRRENFRARHDASTSFAVRSPRKSVTKIFDKPSSIIKQLGGNSSLLVWNSGKSWVFFWYDGEEK